LHHGNTFVLLHAKDNDLAEKAAFKQRNAYIVSILHKNSHYMLLKEFGQQQTDISLPAAVTHLQELAVNCHAKDS